MNSEKLTPFVRRFIRSWKQTIGLQGWTIIWAWETQDEVDHIAGYAAYAVTSYDAAAQTATVRISQEHAWQTGDPLAKEYLPSVLLHELTHIRVCGAEILLGDLGAIFSPFLPEVSAHAVQNAAIGIREFYVDTIVSLLLNQEERWNTKTLTKHKRQ